jgi:hypothetical protein
VLVGRDLIKAAQIRKVTTEIEKYRTAVWTFRDKFAALPGDMPNATNFWGTAPDCTFAAGAGAGSYSGTCNGDGNGSIINTSSGGVNGIEYMKFWQHLSLAGLIDGGPYGGLLAA